MDPPDALRRHLNTLTTYLDIPGDDLHAILDVLIDDITEAVPSFLGLRLTITAGGGSTTIATLRPHQAPTAQASLLLPLEQFTREAVPGDGMVLFAAQPGAFTSLADAAREVFGLDGQVLLDQHLPISGDPVIRTDVDTTQDLRLINIAIGVLIDRGYPPDQARHELTRRAGGSQGGLTAAAQELLDSL